MLALAPQGRGHLSLCQLPAPPHPPVLTFPAGPERWPLGVRSVGGPGGGRGSGGEARKERPWSPPARTQHGERPVPGHKGKPRRNQAGRGWGGSGFRTDPQGRDGSCGAPHGLEHGEIQRQRPEGLQEPGGLGSGLGVRGGG